MSRVVARPAASTCAARASCRARALAMNFKDVETVLNQEQAYEAMVLSVGVSTGLPHPSRARSSPALSHTQTCDDCRPGPWFNQPTSGCSRATRCAAIPRAPAG